MLPFQRLDAIRWLPDLYDPDNPGLAIAENVIPQSQGFSGVRSLSPVTQAVGGLPLNSIFGRDSLSGVESFVGTDNGIFYLERDGSWSQQFPTGVSGLEKWEFTQFGPRVIGITPTQTPHAVDLDDISSLVNSDTKFFSPLSG